jgi:hypothetical protein
MLRDALSKDDLLCIFQECKKNDENSEEAIDKVLDDHIAEGYTESDNDDDDDDDDDEPVFDGLDNLDENVVNNQNPEDFEMNNQNPEDFEMNMEYNEFEDYEMNID